MKHGFCHVELHTTDAEAAKEFFGTVFGWEFVPYSDTFTLFKTPGLGGGLLEVEEAPGDGAVEVYVEVDDVAEALGRVAAAGGEVVLDRTFISDDHGFYAQFRDPTGTKLGLWGPQ